MAGQHGLNAKNWGRRLTAIEWSQYSGVTSSIAWRWSLAALFTRTSTVAEGGQGLLHGGLQGFDIGEVAMEVERRRAALGGERFDEFAGGFVLDIEESDAGTLAGEVGDDGFADARGAAGDQHGAPLEAGVAGKLRVWLRLRLGHRTMWNRIPWNRCKYSTQICEEKKSGEIAEIEGFRILYRDMRHRLQFVGKWRILVWRPHLRRESFPRFPRSPLRPLDLQGQSRKLVDSQRLDH